MSKERIVLVAGGTGGHIFPALALGQELLVRGFAVHVFTDARGKDYAWDPEFHIHTIPSTQMRNSALNVVKGTLGLCTGFFKARAELKALTPHAVVGFGGYATLSTVLAARTLTIPTLIHQGDALLGRVNRLLAPFVSVIATSFEHTSRIKSSLRNKIMITGLPLRNGIASRPYDAPTKDFHLLVIGGSQGAKFFGDTLPQAVQLLPEEMQSQIVIAHQCRPEFLTKVRDAYKNTKAKIELTDFFDRMDERYAWSHLILSRAGASSVLEIATTGRPAIFVPYPFATDDHQTSNANTAVRAGGAWCYQQRDLTAETLSQHIRALIESPQTLSDAAQKIHQIAVEDGAKNIANALNDLIQENAERKLAA